MTSLYADFANDFWGLRHDIASAMSTSIHHVLGQFDVFWMPIPTALPLCSCSGVSVISAALAILPKNLAWLISPFYLCEASTVFVSLMWLLNTFGRGNSPAHTACLASFVLLFFILRVLMLPSFVVYLRQVCPPRICSVAVLGLSVNKARNMNI